MLEVGAVNAHGKGPRKMGARKISNPQTTGILANFERRWLGMMTKMKKINVLIYQVTRFARDNKLIHYRCIREPVYTHQHSICIIIFLKSKYNYIIS